MVNSGTGDPSAAAEIVFWFFVPAIMLMVAKAILFVAQAYASLKLMNNDRLQKALNDLEGEPQAQILPHQAFRRLNPIKRAGPALEGEQSLKEVIAAALTR